MKIPGRTISILWIHVCLVISSAQLSAQNCDGELGAQLFFEDFGSGSGPGPSLPEGTTTYNYGSIGGGNYVVTNSTGLNGSLWHNAPDHTPDDVNGYCLLFDASSNPGTFYNRLFEDLCPNTDYTFSCFVANIVRPFACDGNSIEPNLKFSLFDPSSMIELGAISTGDIETTDEMTWNQYSISFSTNQNQEAILIEITNNASGGCGNDLAIDDFSFNICNPVYQQEFDLCDLPSNMIQVGTEVYSSPGVYETVISLPDLCYDSIVYTTLIANGLTNTNQYVTFCDGDSITIDGVTYYSDAIVIDTISGSEYCTESITYIIEEIEIPTTTEQIYLCGEDSIFISGTWITEAGSYQDTLISYQGCDSVVNIILQRSEYMLELNNSMMTLEPGEAVQLMVTSNPIEASEYQWMPSEFFSCTDCEAPFFTPIYSGTYSVIGFDPVSGCTDSLQFYVEIEPCDGSYFPNAFSPNYDGINDFYQPYLSSCIKQISTFQIFNRWGSLIHVQNNIPAEDIRWDGRFKSKEVAMGVYTYFLNAQIFDGSTKIYTGDITLLR